MKPFDEVLAAGGPLVAAWDHDQNDRTRLCLFSIGAANATIAARTTVPLEQHEAVVERLLDLGVPVGASYGRTTFVWAAGEQAFRIWSDTAAWNVSRCRQVSGVTVFHGERDLGHRGVRLTLAQGGFEIVAEEHDPTPQLDPVYDAENLEDDTRWARALAEQVAVWYLCPLDDEITHTTIEPELAIARALGGLADEVAASSGEIARSLGPIGAARELVYRCTADTLAIEVTGRAATSTAVLKHGTRAQIAAFLRRVSTPTTSVWAINDLAYGR